VTALRDVEWESCLLPQSRDPELEAYLRRELGGVPSMARYFAPCPWVVRSMAGVNHDHALLAHLDLQLADLIGLVVSQDNSCRFCYAAQSVLLRIQGFPDQRIRQLQQDLLSASIGRRESSALEFARRFSRASPLLTWSDTGAMREAGWSDAAIREIAVVGVPDERFGEVGRAYVVLAPGATLDPEGLRHFGRERLAAFKIPRDFIAVERLPRTETGKVQKHALRPR
jgi:AhpD family alkylhydroperoxidase